MSLTKESEYKWPSREQAFEYSRENKKLMKDYISSNDLPEKTTLENFSKTILEKKPCDSYILEQLSVLELNHKYYRLIIETAYGREFYEKLLEDKDNYRFYFIKK